MKNDQVYKGWRLIQTVGGQWYAENYHQETISGGNIKGKHGLSKVKHLIDQEGAVEPVELHNELMELRIRNERINRRLKHHIRQSENMLSELQYLHED